MLDLNIVEKLKERYSTIHPLIFYRSVERARSNVELFDILDSIPKKMPIIWCEEEYRWVIVKDLYLSHNWTE